MYAFKERRLTAEQSPWGDHARYQAALAQHMEGGGVLRGDLPPDLSYQAQEDCIEYSHLFVLATNQV